MSRLADIVIIGGGAMGTSAAFYLAKRNHGKVLLFERTSLGSGATGKSTAVVRQHYSNLIYARWAIMALQIFRNFNEAIGGDCGFIPCGYLVVVGSEDIEPLKANIAMLQDIGVKTELLTPSQVQALQPHLHLDDIALAAIEPEAGCADPIATIRSLVSAAERYGVQVRENEQVLEILQNGDRVTGVRTSIDTIHAGLVIDAAGAFAVQLTEQIGYSAELKLVRHNIVLFYQPPDIPSEHAIISDRINLAYFRPKQNGLTLVGASDPTEGTIVTDPVEENITVAATVQEQYANKLAARFPAFRMGQAIHSSYTGRYHMTVDQAPVLGPIPGVDNFFCLFGLGGHGFKFSVIMGELVAKYLEGDSLIRKEFATFDPERFSQGRLNTTLHPYTKPYLV